MIHGNIQYPSMYKTMRLYLLGIVCANVYNFFLKQKENPHPNQHIFFPIIDGNMDMLKGTEKVREL